MVKLVPDYRRLATVQAVATSANSRVLKKRRPHTKVACNNCRERKWACDGDRPQCLSCRKKGIDCVYTSIDKSETHIGILKRENHALRQHSQRLEELIDLLKNAPSDLARMTLLKLTKDDPVSAINFLRAAYPTTNSYLSEHTTTRAYLPTMHYDQELELLTRYPKAYPLVTNQGPSAVSWQQTMPGSLSSSPIPPLPSDSQVAMGGGIQYGPSIMPQLVDPRLHGLDVTFWTNVNDANKLATGAISFFLETTLPIVCLFDSDLFIDSLLSHSPKFCSSFCLNSLLAFTCQGFAAKYPPALLKSYEFEREADRIFQSEKDIPDTLPSMAGMTLLWLSHLCHGSGSDGIACVKAGFQMAKRLRLFGVPNRLTVTDLNSASNISATAHTAWGCYIASTVQSLYSTPIFTEYPPLFPIPGDTETEENSSPCKDTEPYKIDFSGRGDTFQSFCKFFMIVQKISVKRNPMEEPSDTSLEFTLSEYQKILDMSNKRPSTMICLPGAPYHVFVYHIFFHTITLEIFRPFIADKQLLQRCERSSPLLPSPQAVFAASIKQLKQVILDCSRYQETSWDMFWQVSMMSVTSTIIRERGPEWRMYFFLCIHHFKLLARCFNLVAWVIPGLLAMGLQSGAISSSEAHIIQEEFQQYQRAYRLPRGRGAGFILDMDQAVRDWDAAQADTLAAKFEEISLFDEFTTGII